MFSIRYSWLAGSRCDIPTFPHRRERGYSTPPRRTPRCRWIDASPWHIDRRLGGCSTGRRMSVRRERRTDSPWFFPRAILRSTGPATYRSTSWRTPSTSCRPGRNATLRMDRTRDNSSGPRYSHDSASLRMSWMAIWRDSRQPLDHWLTDLVPATCTTSLGRTARASRWRCRTTSIFFPLASSTMCFKAGRHYFGT